MMFSKILIANRGEIACRIIESAHRLGISTVAVFSDADRSARHVELANEAVYLGGSLVSDSYLRGDLIIAAANSTGAQAIHPGYGFLSENPDFVDSVVAAGLVFIGPSASCIRAMGLKDSAKKLMDEAGVPIVPGYHGTDQNPEFLAEQAVQIGYPVMIKARAGGGGKGMRMVETPDDFQQSLASASREGQASFGDASVLIEKFISNPRHIEVQVFGDSQGNVVHLYERDCSLQRRHQKVIEEAPAPGMPESVRDAMTTAAVTAAKAIEYQGAGTIEFIVDGSGTLRADGFWFMEMNTRLQVEHPVTESITGLDLVETQIRVAAGQALPFRQQDISISGHAFEARLYAEDVVAGFLPSTGRIEHLQFDDEARIDTGVRAGDVITPFYDPMIAKITTSGHTRQEALEHLRHALLNTRVAGTVTNLEFLLRLASHSGFADGNVDTGLIDRELDSLVKVHEPDELMILVATMALYDIKPTDEQAGWRLWGDASVLGTLVFNGQLIKRRLILSGQGAVSSKEINGSEELIKLVVESQSPTHYRVVLSGRSVNLSTLRWQQESAQHVLVQCAGATHEFTLSDPLIANEPALENPDAVVAPMTGIVRVVDVSKGDRVKAGDRLAVVEAMKMETSLIAPRDGEVAAVNCKVDQTVEGGAVLVEMSP
ncbi:MAG: biotin carboxylase N-terminal domain-containing protein [Granulosicoccus sp.]